MTVWNIDEGGHICTAEVMPAPTMRAHIDGNGCIRLYAHRGAQSDITLHYPVAAASNDPDVLKDRFAGCRPALAMRTFDRMCIGARPNG